MSKSEQFTRKGWEDHLKDSEPKRANGTRRLGREQRQTPREFLVWAQELPAAVAPSRAYMDGVHVLVLKGYSIEESCRRAAESSDYAVMTLRDMYREWRREQRA